MWGFTENTLNNHQTSNHARANHFTKLTCRASNQKQINLHAGRPGPYTSFVGVLE